MDPAAIQDRAKGLLPDLLGFQLLEAEPDSLKAEVTVREELCTVPGIMHGGAIMALADTLGGVATMLNLPPGAMTTTVESKTNFLAAARTGDTVTAVCKPLHRGKQTMVWQTRISVGEKTIAQAVQTQIVLEGKKPPDQTMTALFEGKSREEQKALLASLERAGAALYRVLANDEADAAAKEALLAAADREEENAKTLEDQA